MVKVNPMLTGLLQESAYRQVMCSKTNLSSFANEKLLHMAWSCLDKSKPFKRKTSAFMKTYGDTRWTAKSPQKCKPKNFDGSHESIFCTKLLHIERFHPIKQE